MNWEQGGKAAIWYFAVAVIVVASFFIQVLIHYVRDLIARKTGKADAELNEKTDSIGSTTPGMTKLETRQSSVV